MVSDIESIKHNPDDFGGFQTRVLTVAEAAERYCAKKFCYDRGCIQMMIPGEGGRLFRVLCARHFIMLMVMQAAALGDPSPLSEGRRLAAKMGVDFSNVPEPTAPQLVDPETGVCQRCGGGFLSETIGMYAGRRWIHTCVPEEEMRSGEGQ